MCEGVFVVGQSEVFYVVLDDNRLDGDGGFEFQAGFSGDHNEDFTMPTLRASIILAGARFILAGARFVGAVELLALYPPPVKR